MKIYKYPDRKDWPAIVGRQTAGSPDGIRVTVADIMEDVRTGGDSKVLEYVEKLDGYATDAAGLRVSGKEMEDADALVSPELKSFPAVRLRFFPQS